MSRRRAKSRTLSGAAEKPAPDNLPPELSGPGLNLDAMIAWLARLSVRCPRSRCRRAGRCLAVGEGPVLPRAPLPPCWQNAAGQEGWSRARDIVLAEFRQQTLERLGKGSGKQSGKRFDRRRRGE